MKRIITLISISLFHFTSFSQILDKSIDQVDFISVMRELHYLDEFKSTLNLINSESKETSERAKSDISNLEKIYYKYKIADVNDRDKLKNKSFFAEKKIKWLSLEEAISLQVEEPKKILIYVDFKHNTTNKLIKRNLKNNDVINYLNKNYYSVKFIPTLNSKTESKIKYRDQILTFYQFSEYFSINSFPHLIFLDEKNDFISPIEGNIKLQNLELYLKFFASDDFKSIKSRDDFKNYNSNFKPAFSSN